MAVLEMLDGCGDSDLDKKALLMFTHSPLNPNDRVVPYIVHVASSELKPSAFEL